MKKHRGKPIIQITNPEIENYAEKMTSDESEDLLALVKSSDDELDFIDMLSGKLVGQLLKILIKISNARRVLEIGTFTGYSAITMADALPDDGEVTTLEMNLRYQELSEQHFIKFDKQNKITLLKGDARLLVEEMEGEFDLVFLDADKQSYMFYYEKILPLLKHGGLVVVDNVLWDGTVLKPEDAKAQAIHDFNTFVAKDERVEQVLLPVRDGVNIIRKK